eukprot:1148378-Pyramimonas_sp.AAC.1
MGQMRPTLPISRTRITAIVESPLQPSACGEIYRCYRMFTEQYELPVANAVSGNYCQPRCDEPTTEVKFGSASAGNVQSQLPTLMGRTSAENPSSCSGRVPPDRFLN